MKSSNTTADAPDTRRDTIGRVLWGVLAINLAIAAAKLVYGRISGSISVTADGLHSLIDGASNVIGLVGLVLAQRPPDENHPYGHRKYETFAALGIAAMMFLGCFEILSAALDRWRHPQPVHVGWIGVAVIGATLMANLLVVSIERRQGRRLHSEILLSDAAHSYSDMLATVLVLVGFVLVRLGFTWADIAMAVVIVALIVRAGFHILRGTLSTLSDERRIDPALVETEALGEPGVLEAHDVRSRGPDDDIHLDLHILVEPLMAIAEAHAIATRVEERLHRRWPGVTDVVVHVEPALESERRRPHEEAAKG